MRLCHLSLAKLPEINPESWLKTIPYFTRVLDAMSVHHDVASFHRTTKVEKIQNGRVVYQFADLNRIIAAATSFQPEVIIIHGWHEVIQLSKVIAGFNCKIFVQHHGERPFSWPKSWMQKLIDRQVSGYLFSSKQIGESWRKKGLIAADKVFEVMEVASSFHEQETARDENDQTFLWVGRLDENKDPITLVESFIQFANENKKAKLKMVFKEKTLLGEVKKRIADFENNIELIGVVPHESMKAYYEASTFIVSTSKYEGSGIAVLEAISMGCIPIVTDIPSFRKMTHEGVHGILFPAASVTDLLEAFRQALKLDRVKQREALMNYFRSNLSAHSIARQIISIVTLGSKK